LPFRVDYDEHGVVLASGDSSYNGDEGLSLNITFGVTEK